MRTLNDQQRATLLDRLFRRIGNLDDDSLMQLEQLTRVADSGQPLPSGQVPQPPPQALIPAPQSRQAVKPKPDPDQQSRRYFLLTLVAGTILAASAGGAGALALNDENFRRWLSQQGWVPSDTPRPPTGTVGPTLTPTLSTQIRSQITGLQGQVTALTGERDKLRQQFDDLNTHFTALKKANDDAHGLVDLYRQLESINLDQIVIDAIAALTMPILAIDTIRQTLSAGIIVAVRVLQSIEDQMPLIAAGLDWLDQQIANLENNLRVFQIALQKISDSTDVPRAVTDFISTVLDLLPFGAGQNIKAALQAMGAVIMHLPDLLDNVRVRVLEPARAWIVTGKQGGLYDLLLKPMRDQMLAPAQQLVANAQNLNTVYNNQVAQPAQSALDQRAKIRAEITKKAGALPG